MKELYQSKYQKIYLIIEQNLMKQVWQEATQKMTDEEFKKQMSIMFGLFQTHQIDKFLGDTQRLLFIIDPEMQDWINENINMQSKNTRTAFIVSQDFYTQLSMGQIFNDFAESEQFKKENRVIKFFQSEKDALDWLINP